MGGEAPGDRGGSQALLELIEERRSVLTFDFRRYFNLPLSTVGESVTHGEAILLIRELQRESGSHTHMAVYGLTETASLADLAGILHAQKDLNRGLPRGKKPVTLPFPWEQPDPNANVTPERRAELKAQLERRSAFAS
jgi:hypothetical protein